MKRLCALLFCCLLLTGAAAESGEQLTVDFEWLQQLNPDCVGWLYQAESGLNAPVMQHETDDWYRERAFDEVRVYQTGSVYLRAADSTQARVVTLRGQAREDGCLNMLPDWKLQINHDRRSPFYLLTPQGNARAEVFACVEVAKTDSADAWYPPVKGVADWLESRVLPNSLIACEPQSLPQESDRLLFLVGEHPNGSCTLVMARLSPVESAAENPVELTQKAMDDRETQNGMAMVGPAGPMMIYAQNDPLYADMRYESAIRQGSHRDFGGGGCGPTAMAIIAANLLEAEELPALRKANLNREGTRFCACSVNRVYCNHLCVPYRLQTPQQYLRYLPIAMADFAAGNNQWEFIARRVNAQGTNIRFVEYVAQAYGLTMQSIGGLDEALALMKEKTGEGLVLASALRGSPYTNSSHFVVIAAVDDKYFYVIDPLRRTSAEYAKTDTRDILDVLSPGVTRILLDDYGRSDLSPVCYFSK